MFRAAADVATVQPASRAAGAVRVPGDKSISHRYAILAALADGSSTIHGYSPGADCASTLSCLQALGVPVMRQRDTIGIEGLGVRGLRRPAGPLDAGNSGTTLRLLAGVLAAHPFETALDGDASLRRRPMRRVVDPLARMGADIRATDGRPPLVVHGGDLRGITHATEVPSAQVKSAVLLAGLQASGRTTVIETAPTRDHTERALEAFGGSVVRNAGAVAIEGGQRLAGRTLAVPGDISSAVFWAVLAAGTPGAAITIEHVGLNPSRSAVLDVLRRAGARINVAYEGETTGEPYGALEVAFDRCESFDVAPEEVPLLIDELPALAALAAMQPAGHVFSVRGASELRVKESDRISALAAGLRALGAAVDEYPDGFRLEARRLTAAHVDAAGDHRLAMAFAIAATRAPEATSIGGASAVDVSYPGFFAELARLTGA